MNILFTILFVLFTASTVFSQKTDSLAVVAEVDSLLKLNQTLSREKQFDEAFRMVDLAIAKTKAAFGLQHRLYAYCLYIQGYTYFDIKEYDQAKRLFEQSKDIRATVLGTSHEEFGYSLHVLGKIYGLLGKTEEAIAFYQETEQVYLGSIGTANTNYADLQEDLAMIFYSNEAYEKAEPYFKAAKEVRAHILGKDHRDYGRILHYLGNLTYRLGKFKEAETYFLEAREVYQVVYGYETYDYGAILAVIGNLYSGIGQYDQAEKYYLESLPIFSEVLGEEHPVFASIMNNIGVLYKNKGNFERAEYYYIKTRDLRKKVLGEKSKAYAASLSNLGIFYLEIDNYAEAEACFHQSKAIWEETIGKDHPDYASALNNLGMLYVDIGNDLKAEAYYLEAKEVWAKSQGTDHPDYAFSLNNLGSLYKNLGDHDKAEAYYLEAIAIYERTAGRNHPDVASFLTNLGLLYGEIEKYDLAEKSFLESKAIRQELLGTEHHDYALSLNALATLYKAQSKYAQADSCLQESKQIIIKALGTKHSEYASCMRKLASLSMTTEDYAGADSLFRIAGGVEKELLRQASRHISEKELAAYTLEFEDGLHKVYSLSQLYPEGNSKLSRYDFDAALFYKGLLLSTSNRIKSLARSDSNLSLQINNLQAYHRLLAQEYSKPLSERTQIAELEEKANRLEKELTRKVAGFGEAIKQVSWQEVRDQLTEGEAAIEFVHYALYNPNRTDSTMYAALVLKADYQSPKFIPLFEEKEIRQWIEHEADGGHDQANLLYRGIRPRKTRNLRPLSNLLLRPLTESLQDVHTVYFASSGLLHRVNIAALPLNKKNNLGDKLHLLQLSSTRQLALDHPKRDNTANAILIGDISYDMDSLTWIENRNTHSIAQHSSAQGEISFQRGMLSRGSNRWNYLEWTGKEIETIDKILRRAQYQSTMYAGHAATEEMFRHIGEEQPSPKVLHIATHGFFFPDPSKARNSKESSMDQDAKIVFKISDHPMIRSGLILAGGNHVWQGNTVPEGWQDGILTAYEISQMDLSHTELVVLSACETGLGDIEGNEGVYGLQRAFKIAGARYILMSLWQVPDQATQELMTVFYENWLGGMEIRAALQKAQKQMRKKYKEPYYWAGFILVE